MMYAAMHAFFILIAVVRLALMPIAITEKPEGIGSDEKVCTQILPTPMNTKEAPEVNNVHVRKSFSLLPLYFIENQGQMNEKVAYYVRGSDKTLYFTSTGVTFALMKGKEKADSMDIRDICEPSNEERAEPEYERWIVKLDFLDMNIVKPRGEEKQEAIFSYFRGKSREWKTGIPTFNRIIYEDLWPGIDLVYFGFMNGIKYEFIVKPGSDVGMIRLVYQGVSDVHKNEMGALEISTPACCFEDGAPLAYQVIDGNKVEVSVGYALQRRAMQDACSVGFDVGAFDRNLPLIIDPEMLIYCGYIGGAGDDICEGVAVDGSGCAYVTGWTNSDESSFPVCVGPDITYNDNTTWTDAFVAKLSASGNSLVYCGYIGGQKWDYGRDIAVDGAGCAYITGQTNSTEKNFPVHVGPDLTYNGGSCDAFVAKVNASGIDLSYCGYIGGTIAEIGYGIAVDAAGCAYLTGYTASLETGGFPVQLGPDLTYNGGQTDCFVAKVDAAGTSLDYCGYIGGAGQDAGMDIALGISGDAYITGHTDSSESSFPVLVGPDLTMNGFRDGFIARVSNPGAGLDFCGYIGGDSNEEGLGIAVDEDQHAYVTGRTNSTESSFPVKKGPDLTFNCDPVHYYDAFITKVECSGETLLYSGYIGGGKLDFAYDVAVDNSSCAYATGITSSSENDSFPLTVGPGLSHNGGFDAFVAKVDAEGIGIEYCGYIGGAFNDESYGIAVDGSGNAYVCGTTKSPEASFPVVMGPDLTHNGFYDAFVSKIIRFKPILHVPGDYPTIQDAIDAALLSGNTVIVAPGTYVENIDFSGKAVLVKSSDGPDVTVIDGNQSGSVVKFANNENFGSILEGFTITNGSGTYDPAVGSSLYGGGVYCFQSSPTIRYNTIRDNLSDYGGGIFCTNSSPDIYSNNISYNNTNQPVGSGSGMYLHINCTPIIKNNIISNNVAPFEGGGIRSHDSYPTLVNNTIYGNIADSGGGIYCDDQTSVYNTVIWNNFASMGPQIYGNPDITYSDIHGGYPGTGNIDSDPLFVDPLNDDFHLSHPSPCIDAGDNYAPSLPAMDFEGDPRVFPGNGKGVYLVGSPSHGAVVDMGADEYCLLKRWKPIPK